MTRTKTTPQAASPKALLAALDRLPLAFALFDAKRRLAAWNAPLAALGLFPKSLLKQGASLAEFQRRDPGLKRKAPGPHDVSLPTGEVYQVSRRRVPPGQLLVSYEDVTEARLARAEAAEALERQTATAEILKVIASSPSNVQPVFEAILESAMRLTRGFTGALFTSDGVAVNLAALHQPNPEAAIRFRDAYPMSIEAPTPAVTAIRECRALNLGDSLASDFPESVKAWAREGGYRAVLSVPMRSGHKAVGGIAVTRREAGEFSEHEVALLGTFADQAVIAIENVRLFNETKEALQRQTATAEILEVISKSQTNVQPVFDAIAENALRLCDGTFSTVNRFDGKLMDVVATSNASPEALQAIRAAFPAPLGRGGATTRSILERRVVEIVDITKDEEYSFDALARASNYRSIVAVPMLHAGNPIGAIAVVRPQTGAFPEQQIALLKTFADQAVIAIENVRLFNETKEALERQTATAEILKVIASSPSDVQPVLDAVAATAARLCEATDAVIQLHQGDALHNVAHYGNIPTRVPGGAAIARGYVTGRALMEGRQIHIHDLAAEIDEFPEGSALARRLGWKTTLATPLIREGIGLGVLMIRRTEARPFREVQIALVGTFADQAVIAIENVRLFNETKEALAQQTATAEILRVISGSLTDVQPVFSAIVQSCSRLFSAGRAALALVHEDRLDLRATSEAPGEADSLFEIPLDRTSALGTSMLEARTIHVPDLAEVLDRYPKLKEYGYRWGYRSALFAPLLKEGRAIGGISVFRSAAGAFSEKEMALLQTFADQAVIAIENVRLFNETKEALERQTATAEILKVISSSPTDTRPVFEAIANSALRLFSGQGVGILLADGNQLQLGAACGSINLETARKRYPLPLDRQTISGQAILDRTFSDIADTESPDTPDLLKNLARELGYRAIASAPMVKEGDAIGAITVVRTEPGALEEKEIALLRTFTDQAVIAIENVRLFRALEERNRDVTDALEQQTATAEILRVISSSPTNVQPVFEAVVQSGLRVFAGSAVGITLVEGDHLRINAMGGLPVGLPENAVMPFGPGSATGTAIVERAVVNIRDTEGADAPPYARENGRTFGFRAIGAAPMLREGTAIGAIAVMHVQPGGLNDKQLQLLKTFADQAVIAIENVRLFNETKEALERQTATAEILRVIASSPSDVRPVLDTVAERAARLCDVPNATVWLADGETLRPAATFWQEGGADGQRGDPVPISTTSINGRAVLERRTIHVADIVTLPENDYPHSHERSRRLGFRAVLVVPMIREGNAIGTISLWRRETGLFSDTQLALLQTFADQAVIAIGNVRLFNETKEALERQTATAEILKVIASSPSDVQPIFDAIAGSALRLINGLGASVTRVVGDAIHLSALTSTTESGNDAVRGSYPMPLASPTVITKAVRTLVPVFRADIEHPEVPDEYRQAARVRGYRSIIAVPMLREGACIGTINVVRREPGSFSDHQISLLKTFADQAVIAIENVRLFNETKEALEQQTSTAEILRVISSSPTDVTPVFEAIAERARALCGAHIGATTRFDGELLHLVGYHGSSPEGEVAMRAAFPMKPGRGSINARVVAERKPIEIPDVSLDAEYQLNEMARKSGFRSLLAVPMLHGENAIGVIGVGRVESGAFPEKAVALLQTFAAQAVIAVENVRLFNETKEALERQTATAEILRVISSSPTDDQPVFDAIVESATRLFAGRRASVRILDGGKLVLRAWSRKDLDDYGARFKLMPADRDSVVGKAVLDCKVMEVTDNLAADSNLFAKKNVGKIPFRSICVAPLAREGIGIGTISVTSQEPGALPEKQKQLLQTFADQAVIAIENVRLFKELQSRTEALTKSVGQLTALGEVGQAISSTLDLETVLQTIVSHAVKLTGLDGGSMYEYDESREEFRLQASDSQDPELLEAIRRAPIRKGDGTVGGTAVTLEAAQVPDILDAGYQSSRKELLIRAGYRAILTVPLLREDRVIGALSVTRKTPGTFAPEVVELLKTFATQSAMAIQNARLFREIAEKGKQLEVASQHKSNFLASMSHELRTPLNAILGFNEMIIGQVYGEVPADMQEPLNDIQTSGKHLLRLINNVLDLAKIEAGRMELSLQDYSVHDTVGSVHSTLRPLAAEKGLEFLANVPNDVPLAYGDGGRMTQCLMNLAGNSLKFTKAGKVEILVETKGDLLVYKVTDTGIGIPPDKIGSLFTEFKQTDATIASEYGGTGLGLSISRKFVEMHGGRIWVESELGKGSAFIIEVPLRVKTP